VLEREVGRDHIRTRRQRPGERLDDLRRILLVHDPVQERDEYEPDRLAEVDHVTDVLVVEDRLRFARVRVNVGGPALGRGGQQGPRVSEDQGVVVAVHDPAGRVDGLGDLVHAVRRRQPGADVEELPDARLGRQVPHGPAQERPVLPRGGASVRRMLQHLLRQRPVGGEVVLPADHVVVHAGGMRSRRINLGQEFAHIGLSKLGAMII